MLNTPPSTCSFGGRSYLIERDLGWRISTAIEVDVLDLASMSKSLTEDVIPVATPLASDPVNVYTYLAIRSVLAALLTDLVIGPSFKVLLL